MAVVPFNRPFTAGDELSYISQAVRSGNTGGDGLFTRRCSRLLEQRFGIHKVLMTPSCTAALEMAAMLAGLGPGDEVIMPSYTFVSTANAVVRQGARPVFVDIRVDTLNLDEQLVEEAITDHTRAIVPVHYGGVSSEMKPLRQIAAEYELKIIEDAAQGVNSYYRGRALGTFGHLGCYSFHETKNYACGQGGALCINSPELVERAEIIRDKGTNRRRFLRGDVNEYTWIDVGASYVPSEINCAYLYGQLLNMDAISDRRQALYQRYHELLQPLADEGFLSLPNVPPHCRSNHHLFYLVLPTRRHRDALLSYLNRNGVNAVFHYVPLHTSPMGRRLGCENKRLPVTESISERLVRLPLFHDLTEQQQSRIAKAITRFVYRQRNVGRVLTRRGTDLQPAM